jgi:hypothetical protein
MDINYDEIIVTMDDVRKAGGCAWGALRWLKRHNLDHKKFFNTKNPGLPASQLIATGDVMAMDVVRIACEQ